MAAAAAAAVVAAVAVHCKNLTRHFDDNSMATFYDNIVVTAT